MKKLKLKNMTVKEMANRLIGMFGSVESARQYVILWQDEYVNEDDKLFRQEVKNYLDKM